MKKILKLTGVASALAMLPTASVLAATGTTVNDTVQVTINTACSITATAMSSTYSATITNGNYNDAISGTSMSISCNDAGGWKLSAIGAGAVSGDATKMKPTGSGTAIATGTAKTGATSNWAFKVTGTNATGYTTFTAVPATAATVATSAGTVSANTVTATYQVYISPTQQADTYTGKVTYTLSNPA